MVAKLLTKETYLSKIKQSYTKTNTRYGFNFWVESIYKRDVEPCKNEKGRIKYNRDQSKSSVLTHKSGQCSLILGL